MHIEQTRTKWGYTKFGNRRTPTMAIAIPLGIVVGITGGWLSATIGVTGPNPTLGFWVFASCLTMPAIALVFALIVDRSTLQGATERTEDSIESRWYDKAASGSFTDLILVLGLTSLALAFVPRDVPVDLKLVLPAIIGVCVIPFGVRYLLLRRKG